MEKRYILRKVGKCAGCVHELQDRLLEPCWSCERNEQLIESISDNFEKRTIAIPEPPIADDTQLREEANDKLLADWGVKRKVQ